MTPAELATRFLALDTGHICDALEPRGLTAITLPDSLRPFTGRVKFAGPAHTIELVKARSPNLPRRLVEAVDELSPGEVVVVDAGGTLEWSVFGSRMAARARTLGACGAVVNGAIRDIDGMNELEFPVHAAGRSLLPSEGRFHGLRLGEPVAIGGAVIQPGDWMVGDASGICIVPAEIAEAILTAAEEREAVDRETMAEILRGSTLHEAHRHYAGEDPPAGA